MFSQDNNIIIQCYNALSIQDASKKLIGNGTLK